MNTTYPFDHDNAAISTSRTVVHEHIALLISQGRLSELVEDQNAVVTYLARTRLSRFVITGQIRRSMIERWVQEAVAAASQLAGHNVLTGEIVYKIWCEVRGHTEIDWSDPKLPESVQIAYDVLAAKLMDVLYICYMCGEHPPTGDMLVEKDHMMVCPACLHALRQSE